jgi:iron(III) transport system permease protein
MTSSVRTRGLTLFASLLTALLMVPVVVVAASWFQTDSGTWAHICATTLPALASDSFKLTALVALGVAILGTVTAWVTARYEWRGRRAAEWLLVLPLAVPAYVMAYGYTDLLQYAGPLQTTLRETFGWTAKSDYWFFEIRSLGGAAAMLTLALYPYVYLLARVAFLSQPASLDDAGRTFGYSRRQLFWHVSLPLARPAIAAGVALAMMETLADYGTVSYFGINTFTTGIFSAWFAQGDRIAAAKLATLLLGVVAIVSALEWWARRNARYADLAGSSRRTVQRLSLSGRGQLSAIVICVTPIVLGFVLPLMMLIRLVLNEPETLTAFSRLDDFLQLAWNSFSLASVTALAAVAISVVLCYAKRQHPIAALRLASRAVGLGYAIPGTVIAIGVLIPLTLLDHHIADIASALIGRDTGLLLTGGLSVLIYAYLIRFLSISLQTVDAGFAQITPSMDDAARSLGTSNLQIVKKVHAPLLKTSLITAALLVFVDVMKELPATLVMRPFNFDTLAVRTYTFAKDERLAEASLAAFVIVLVGLIPVIIASRAITRGTHMTRETQGS